MREPHDVLMGDGRKLGFDAAKALPSVYGVRSRRMGAKKGVNLVKALALSDRLHDARVVRRAWRDI
jgi:hypothetical protein